jgi:hypothetical protein
MKLKEFDHDFLVKFCFRILSSRGLSAHNCSFCWSEWGVEAVSSLICPPTQLRNRTGYRFMRAIEMTCEYNDSSRPIALIMF